ncbi:hypothetical protein [Clostridium botulinum]|nr:hypothetical protein [Clostridium botulinum]
MVDKKYYLVNKENNFTQFIFTVQQHHDYCITGGFRTSTRMVT